MIGKKHSQGINFWMKTRSTGALHLSKKRIDGAWISYCGVTMHDEFRVEPRVIYKCQKCVIYDPSSEEHEQL